MEHRAHVGGQRLAGHRLQQPGLHPPAKGLQPVLLDELDQVVVLEDVRFGIAVKAGIPHVVLAQGELHFRLVAVEHGPQVAVAQDQPLVIGSQGGRPRPDRSRHSCAPLQLSFDRFGLLTPSVGDRQQRAAVRVAVVTLSPTPRK